MTGKQHYELAEAILIGIGQECGSDQDALCQPHITQLLVIAQIHATLAAS